MTSVAGAGEPGSTAPRTTTGLATSHASDPGASGSACESLGEPLARVMTLLGKRWTGMVLSTLLLGPAHFNELCRAVPGISDRVLTERLVELASQGLVTRTVLTGPPIGVRYEVTEHGAALRPAIEALTRWAEDHLA